MVKELFAAGLFEGRVAIVTGGGTGIGLAVARELRRLGARVAICGRRPEPLAAAVEALGGGPEVLAAACDIRDPDSIGGFVQDVLEHFDRVGVLVNNARGPFPPPAQHLSPKGFEAGVGNNLLGTYNFTHKVANMAMIPQKSGRIVNVIAQIARGFPGMSHTGAARAGVANLTMSLAVEWAQFGIRVNAVAPGVIRTSGLDQYPPQLLVDAVNAIPLRRLGAAEEVSHLVTYLASPHADFITGQILYIDGGASIWSDQWPIPADVPQSPPYPTDE